MKLIIMMLLVFTTAPAFAAEVDLGALGPILKPVLEILFSYLPSGVISAITLIGGLRVLFKPLMAFLEAVAIYTPGKKDDALFKSVNEGNTYKSFRFFLDFIASIKLPPKK
jgi:hypothetical protein